ncbi:unnamed protein product [Pedinophyceae sp. YPF-701]|nr:unnamed protein product [Pedinophyceae sp. YPF-701]
MGNLLCKENELDESVLKPQGLYNNPYIDHRRLRKLILRRRLAPCFSGRDEDAAAGAASGDDGKRATLDECPICMLYYPSLNRTRCCQKEMCTECFLQLKIPAPDSTYACPFCKKECFYVTYRPKTTEEREAELRTERAVEEAKVKAQAAEAARNEARYRRRREREQHRRAEQQQQAAIASPPVGAAQDGQEAPDLNTTSFPGAPAESAPPSGQSRPSPEAGPRNFAREFAEAHGIHLPPPQRPSADDDDSVDSDPFQGYRHEADERIATRMRERESQRRRAHEMRYLTWFDQVASQLRDFVPPELLQSLRSSRHMSADLEELMMTQAILMSLHDTGDLPAASGSSGAAGSELGENEHPAARDDETRTPPAVSDERAVRAASQPAGEGAHAGLEVARLDGGRGTRSPQQEQYASAAYAADLDAVARIRDADSIMQDVFARMTVSMAQHAGPDGREDDLPVQDRSEVAASEGSHDPGESPAAPLTAWGAAGAEPLSATDDVASGVHAVAQTDTGLLRENGATDSESTSASSHVERERGAAVPDGATEAGASQECSPGDCRGPRALEEPLEALRAEQQTGLAQAASVSNPDPCSADTLLDGQGGEEAAPADVSRGSRNSGAGVSSSTGSLRPGDENVQDENDVSNCNLSDIITTMAADESREDPTPVGENEGGRTHDPVHHADDDAANAADAEGRETVPDGSQQAVLHVA